MDRIEAAEKIDGSVDGEYVYYHDDATNHDFRNPVEDLDFLIECIESDNEQVSRDYYSHWCAGTCAEDLDYERVKKLNEGEVS